MKPESGGAKEQGSPRPVGVTCAPVTDSGNMNCKTIPGGGERRVGGSGILRKKRFMPSAHRRSCVTAKGGNKELQDSNCVAGWRVYKGPIMSLRHKKLQGEKVVLVLFAVPGDV